MKIDLHIHTKGDKIRTIDNENLIKTLTEAKVNLAAITEHNEFDVAQFTSLSTSENISFVPGVEVDVIFPAETIHIIVLSDSKDLILDFCNQGGFSENAFIDKLNQVKSTCLISIHFQKDKGFKIVDDVKKFRDKISNAFVKFMLELPSNSKILDNQRHIDRTFHTAHFSDVRDWSKYVEESKALPETSLQIDSLAKYISHFVDKRYQFSVDSIVESKNYTFTDFERNLKTIQLSRGLNVVFGSKGAGKTKFIDAFHKKNKSTFSLVKFGESTPDALSPLFTQMLNDNLIDTKYLTDLKNLSINFNGEIKQLTKCEFGWDINVYIENLRLYLKRENIQKYVERVSYISNKYQDLTNVHAENIKVHKEIHTKIVELIALISKPTYIGSLKASDIVELGKENIRDWILKMKFNHHRFIKVYMEIFEREFRLQSKPALNLNANIEKMLAKVKESIKIKKVYLKMNSMIVEPEKIMLSSDLNEGKYTFSYFISKRNNAVSSTNDYSEISQPISEAFTNHMKFESEVLSAMTISEVLKLNNTNLGQTRLSNLYNIEFNSSFDSLKDYIPSTGQYDMIKITEHLKNHKNLVIDEFCNTLDNEYVFKLLIPHLNEYKGVILAATHNPIIVSIAVVGKYFFRKKDGKIYKTFESEDGIFGDLVFQEERIPVIKQLIDTIEGTKDAFIVRKEKYEFE